jgi:DNA repair exonuclease SbcCD ATPase subunit
MLQKVTKTAKKKIIKDDNITILENEDNIKIKHIVHLGDIHIRMQDRKEEYISVFERLYEDIKKKKLNRKNSIIVICGDIMHDKENLHPSSLEMCINFFTNLAAIAPVIVISGNHDKCDNNSDIDVIKTILNIKFNTENKIYHIDNNGLYLYNNIVFGLTQVFEMTVTPCILSTKYKDKIKVGLYHGRVISPLNEREMFFVKDSSIDYKEFNDYNITLLGDIHQQSYLNEEKTIAYSGSLIQQNKSESINKGYLLWNIEDAKSATSEFRRINNDYMTLKITIGTNGKWKKPDLNSIPKYAKFDIISNSENQSDIDSIYKWYEDNGTKIIERGERFEVHKNKINNLINIEDTTNKLSLLSNKEKICDTILKGIKDEFKNESIKNKIKNLVKDTELKDISVKNIKLITLQFSNFMKYGENNKINFENLKNINGLFSANSSGKSTLIDVILFSIYGESTRGNTIDLINNDAKFLTTEIELEVNAIRYKIVRKVTRKEKKQYSRKVSSELLIYENGKNISSDIKKNMKIIQEKISSYEDFIHNAIIAQNTRVNFLNFTPKEKNEYLYKIFNIQILKDIDKTCSTYVRNLKVDLTKKKRKLLDYESYGKDEKEIEKNIDKELEKVKSIKDTIEENTEDNLTLMSEYKSKIVELEKSLNNNDTYNTKINISKGEYGQLLKDIDNDKKTKEELEEKIETLNANKIINNKLIQKKNYEKILSDFNIKKDKTIQLNCNKIKVLQSKIMNDLMFNIKQYSKKQIEKELEDIHEEYNKIEILYEDNNDELKRLNKIITTKDIKYNKNTYDEYIEKHTELEIKIKTKRMKEETNKDLKQKIVELESYSYDEDCEYCMKNSMTKDKILYLKQLETNEKELKMIGREITNLEKYIEKNITTVTLYEQYNKLKEVKDEAAEKIETIEVKQQMIKLKLEGLSNSIKMKDTILMKIKNYDMNKEIMEQIIKLETMNEDIRKEVNKDYELYLETQKEITQINNIIDLNKIKLNKIETDIKYKENKIKSYEDNQYTIKHQLELHEIKGKYEKINELNMKLKTELQDCNEKVNKIKLDKLLFEDLNKELNKLKLDKDEYEIISKFISGEDFTIKIMQETILPTITENMNKMLQAYSDYTIKMVLNKDTGDSIYIYKLDGSNLSLNGGYESHLINLIFRMVFTKISGLIRTNFIIIDEAFDASDMANKSNIKNIIDFMDNIYDWGIIISHDAYIRTNFDKHITIKKIKEIGTNREKQFISI